MITLGFFEILWIIVAILHLLLHRRQSVRKSQFSPAIKVWVLCGRRVLLWQGVHAGSGHSEKELSAGQVHLGGNWVVTAGSLALGLSDGRHCPVANHANWGEGRCLVLDPPIVRKTPANQGLLVDELRGSIRSKSRASLRGDAALHGRRLLSDAVTHSVGCRNDHIWSKNALGFYLQRAQCLVEAWRRQTWKTPQMLCVCVFSVRLWETELKTFLLVVITNEAIAGKAALGPWRERRVPRCGFPLVNVAFPLESPRALGTQSHGRISSSDGNYVWRHRHWVKIVSQTYFRGLVFYR